ncbi:recombinase A [Thiorhodococcus mannitoliphagus]|uniref:Recombinase A n=1 Tax=Thiorhodococcus mannitoliphagus TaxID=329406 RepID=A0A6P1DMF3_9GAMM|nr:recombinase A [Thiorhodococcus mannitoliphagus]NEX19437.1 recombinase A [Thiorhodococcus mannitoliphagus]
MQRSTAIALTDLQQGLKREERPATWNLSAFAGRFSEISGTEATAALSLAVDLVGETQRGGEPVAWITRRESSFYPPDVAATGVDLGALAVVWTPGTLDAARAADLLLRSGAFGLIVMDLGRDDDLPLAAQNRLAALAKKHDTALLCLTRKEAHQPSVGSLISLRAQATRTERAQQHFHCEARILKDKRLGPGWTHRERYHGPDGLC